MLARIRAAIKGTKLENGAPEPGREFSSNSSDSFLSGDTSDHPDTGRQAHEDEQSSGQKQDNRHWNIADDRGRRRADASDERRQAPVQKCN